MKPTVLKESVYTTKENKIIMFIFSKRILFTFANVLNIPHSSEQTGLSLQTTTQKNQIKKSSNKSKENFGTAIEQTKICGQEEN